MKKNILNNRKLIYFLTIFLTVLLVISCSANGNYVTNNVLEDKMVEDVSIDNVIETQPPDVVGPDAVGPDSVGPDVVGPDVVGPDAVGPDAVEPDVVEPDAVEPDAVGPDAVEPNVVEPNVVEPNVVEPEEPDVISLIETLKNKISNSDEDCWRKPAQNRKDTIINKLTSLQDLILQDFFEEAYNKMLHDIKPKLTALKTDEYDEPWGNGTFKQAWVVCQLLRDEFLFDCNEILTELNPTPPM